MLTPAQRQNALVLAGEGERHRRNVRRRTILLIALCVLLLVGLTILVLSVTTGTSWMPTFSW